MCRYYGIGLTFSGGQPCFTTKARVVEDGRSGGSNVTGDPRFDDEPDVRFDPPVEFKSLDFCDPCTKAWVECLVSFIPLVGDAYGCAEPLLAAPTRR